MPISRPLARPVPIDRWMVTVLRVIPTTLTGTSPLSFEQEHVWNMEWVPNIPPMALRLTGELQTEVLEDALHGVVSRHEILQTGFRQGAGEGEAFRLAVSRTPLPIHDLRALDGPAQLAAARELIRSEAKRPFKLCEPPLMHAGLIQLGATDNILFFTMHHIICDLWSMKLFLREVASLYTAHTEKQDIPLAPLRVQYSDYATCQRLWLRGDALAEHLSYWREALRGASPLQLPTVRNPPNRGNHEGGVRSAYISHTLTTKLQDTCKQLGATLFMTLLAAFQVLMFQYTGQDDVVVSSLTANRSQVELEPLIGVFANRLSYRTRFGGNPRFREALSQVRDTCLNAYKYQALSLWKLTELTPGLDPGTAGKVLFALQNVPTAKVTMPDINMEPFESTGISMFEETGMKTTGRYDQSWEVWKDAGQLRVVVSFRSDRFDNASIDQALRNYSSVLEQLVETTGRRVDDFHLYS
jgi:hypothetical protein